MTRFNRHVLATLPFRPETVYIVRRNTLPHVIAGADEAYRLMLGARSQRLA